ncbi:unnamed protein product [Linum trigynum]|uniref:Uncharacterized protein n=1 Tax=Linum trigynum TaxID=586398 RepID=A0AAV2GKW7_9ROSI
MWLHDAARRNRSGNTSPLSGHNHGGHSSSQPHRRWPGYGRNYSFHIILRRRFDLPSLPKANKAVGLLIFIEKSSRLHRETLMHEYQLSCSLSRQSAQGVCTASTKAPEEESS